jgi:phospholipid transport system substrate-binding protein
MVDISTLKCFVWMFFLIGSIGLQASGKVGVDDSLPQRTIKMAAKQTIDEIVAVKPEDRDYEFVKKIVNAHIIPIVDAHKVAQLSLGKYWKKASEKEKEDFVDAIIKLQLKTYSNAFKSFGGQNFSFIKTRFNTRKNKAIVKSLLIQSNGRSTPVDFSMILSKKDKKWRVYNSTIAGVSIIHTQKILFSERLKHNSLSEVIIDMNNEAANIK